MSFNFHEPMTAYELLAIVISIVALAIPGIQWIWKNWICKANIEFLPSGQVTIYFNRSGSYLSFGGVYKAKNKSATVTSVSSSVIRKSDKAVLDLRWSSFSSPVFRKIAGTYETSFETAHPFMVKKDDLSPVFVEFEVKEQDVVGKELIQTYYKTAEIVNRFPDISIAEAEKQLRCTSEYSDSFTKINDLFFWQPGKYQMTIRTEFDSQKETNIFEFDLSDFESKQLRCNIDSLLTWNLVLHFTGNMPNMNVIRKDFIEVP